MIFSSSVDFNFGIEDTLILKELRCVGVNSKNFINISFSPQSNEYHDYDDFVAEGIKVELRRVEKDKITVAALAPDGASKVYSFKFIVQYGN